MKTSPTLEVTIYTDGACTGNPGPGGFGVVLIYRDHRRELSRGFRRTTNNRMELLAMIAGLEALKDSCRVTLYSDSQYVVDSINQGWAKRWRENGWKRSKKEKARNPDLWTKLLDLLEKRPVDVRWIKGHSGDPENERADFLATRAIKGSRLEIDQAYEKLHDQKSAQIEIPGD